MFPLLQGLITFLVDENGFNGGRVTKVCSIISLYISSFWSVSLSSVSMI